MMDTRLLARLPTEQARCREIARHFHAMGSIGCFAAALIEQALQRADRAIIEGAEEAVRGVLDELLAFDLARPGKAGDDRLAHRKSDAMLSAGNRLALTVLPVGRRPGRLAVN